MQKVVTLLIIFLFIALILKNVLAGSHHLGSLSVLPGPEGSKVGVYSVQNPVTGKTCILGGSGDSDASVFPIDPFNIRYDPDLCYAGYPDFYVSLSKVWSEGEALDKPIDYWIYSNGRWVHIFGKIHVVYFNILFYAEPSGDANVPPPLGAFGTTEYEKHWDKGEFWFAIGTTVWNQAYTDPSLAAPNLKWGRVWSTPLSAFITNIQTPDKTPEGLSTGSQFTYMNPQVQVGRQVTLFSNTQGGNIIDIIGNIAPNSQDYNATLYSLWGSASPDTRMSSVGYFVFEPTDFGVNWWYPFPYTQISYICPAIQATVKMYVLTVGDFIYTNEEYENWVLGEGKHQYQWWDYFVYDVQVWFSNPFNILGLVMTVGTFVIIVIVILACIVLFWFFGSPKRRHGKS